MGAKFIPTSEREYVILKENTFVFPEFIKELKGEILINSNSIDCLKKITNLETLNCFIDVKEEEYYSLFKNIRYIKDIKFTLIILEEDIEKVQKCIDIYREITNLDMVVTKIESISVQVNGQFIHGHWQNLEFEEKVLVEIESS